MSKTSLDAAGVPAGETASDPVPTMSAGNGLLAYARETRADSRTFRYSLGLALLFHAILLVVKLPDLYGREQAPPPEPEKLFVVQQVRFKPPPPTEEIRIPKPKSKKVPIPDPTPDDLEPIRVEEPEIFMPEVDDLNWNVEPPAPPPPRVSGPIEVTRDVIEPRKTLHVKPQYTEIARKARIQGRVVLRATIDQQGDITDVEVLRGLPMGLAEAAVAAVRQWKFKPATLNGRPVAVYFNLTVTFQLQ
ncbi:MAG: energy transducer TonB [Acidobacteria bacterium]|nr:energy transducer TonB [Acidobacteriota bacterium]